MDVEAHPVTDGTIRLRVAGEIDMETAGEFRAALIAAVTGDGVASVVADFALVTFCDSAGIAALDAAYALAADRNANFRLIDVQPAVRRVLEITGMLESLTGPGTTRD